MLVKKIKIFSKEWFDDFVFENDSKIFEGKGYDYVYEFLHEKYKINYDDKAIIITEEMLSKLIDLTVEKLKTEDEYLYKRLDLLSQLILIKHNKLPSDYYIELKKH